MTADLDCRIDIINISAQSDLVVNLDLIRFTVSFEMQCAGVQSADAVDWHMTLLPMGIPFTPETHPEAGRDPALEKFLWPSTPNGWLKQWCDRAAQIRYSSVRSDHRMQPGEVVKANAAVGFDIDLLYEGGTLFDDGSMVPVLYTCTSYVCGDARGFNQIGQAFQLRARDPSGRKKTCDPVLERLPIRARDLRIIPHSLTPRLEREFKL